MRFYRRDDTDGSLQFVGENSIDHTPVNERLRLYTGNAFDLVGERRRTNYKRLPTDDLEETFEIVVRNHKKEPVEVRVVEHLRRWPNWEVTQTSHDFTKMEANTIEFRVTVLPEGPMVLTYTVKYDWPP